MDGRHLPASGLKLPQGALVLLCAVLLAPLAVVDVPPLLDYPNHLARAVVLASGASDPVLARMYAARWAIIPNLGTDLVLVPLLHVLPIHVVGRMVVGIILLLPVLGAVAYSRATFRTAAIWPLASVLVAYNATLLLGFLNFVAAIGLALLFAAGWMTWRERRPVPTIVAACIGTVALFLCHLMGLVFFYLLIAGYELELIWSLRKRTAAAATRLFNVVPVVALPLGLYMLSPLAPLADATEFSSLADKARQLLFPFANYILPLDIITACIVGAFLLGCIAMNRCRITPSGAVTLIMTTLLFIVAPWALKGTYFFDTRFVIMLGFLVFGALLPTGLSRAAALLAVAAFTVLFAARMAVVVFAWEEHRNDVAQLRHVIGTVEPGTRVFIASVSPAEAEGYWANAPLSRHLSNGLRLDDHLPALLLIERLAYWPFLFDNPSQQPVETLSPYRELAARAGSIADHGLLTVPGKIDLCGYDYLLLLDAGGEPNVTRFAEDRLMLLGQSDLAALFRIKPSACAS
jgi:hypothetical protein